MEKQNLEIYDTLTQKLLCCFVSENEKNVVFSPLSILVLLAILADATGNETRAEIAKALGFKENVEEFIEEFSADQGKFMESGALISSNAVCIRKDLKDKITSGYEKHLQDVFGGKLFMTTDMAGAVNKWVNEKTKGMIPKITDESMNAMLACLLNAIAFEAKWNRKYEFDDIDVGDFTNCDGSCNAVNVMRSTEWQYIEDAHFTGFTKPYKNVGYSFMALLPKNEKPDFMRKALKDMNLTKLFNSRHHEKVYTIIPEYTLEFGRELTDFCKSLGIEKAFSDNADFSPMMDEWLKVDKIIHKAKIRVDRNGTKAVALTMAAVAAGCALEFDYKVVALERPFVFAIVHDDSGLPVFAGVVNHLEESYTEPESFEPEEVLFDSDEEFEEYMKMKFHNIANRIHPDNSPLYESSEDIRELFAEAQRYYKEKDPYGIQVVEYNLNRLLDELKKTL